MGKRAEENNQMNQDAQIFHVRKSYIVWDSLAWREKIYIYQGGTWLKCMK